MPRVVGLLAQVADRAPEAAAVAEVLLDLVGHVVDADVDLPDPTTDDVEHDPLDDGAAGDVHQRLGRVPGELTQAGPLAAGHDDRDVGKGLRTDDVGEGVQPEDPPLGVDLGDGRDAECPQQVEDQGARGARVDRLRVGRGVGAGRVVEGCSAEHRPPEVAVRHQAEEPAVLVGQDAHRGREPVDHQRHVPQGRVDGCARLLQLALGHWLVTSRLMNGLARGKSGAARTISRMRALASPAP